MVQFDLLTEPTAGRTCVARRFPFHIGRAADAHWTVEGDGIWDCHLTVHFHRRDGYHIEAHPDALLSLNGERVEHARLRNGDLIEIGSAKIRFWLAPARQRSLRPREILTWLGLCAVAAAQIGLIYLLSE